MSNRFTTLSATALMLAALATSALAEEPGAVYGAKTVGAMTFETRGIATNATQVGRQGGFATAGAAQWTAIPADQITTGSIRWVSAPAR